MLHDDQLILAICKIMKLQSPFSSSVLLCIVKAHFLANMAFYNYGTPVEVRGKDGFLYVVNGRA